MGSNVLARVRALDMALGEASTASITPLTTGTAGAARPYDSAHYYNLGLTEAL